MPKSYRVTIPQLKKAGACYAELQKMRRIFPNGHVITEQFCVDTAEIVSWYWAVYNLLQGPRYRNIEGDIRAAMRALRKRLQDERQRFYGDITANLDEVINNKKNKRIACRRVGYSEGISFQDHTTQLKKDEHRAYAELFARYYRG